LTLGVRGIDTAYNYRDFTSHRALSRAAAELLGQFTLSTKVGFFPGSDAGHAVHSLEPARLRGAVERSADELGRPPDVVFLHSPERTLADLPTQEGRERLHAACAALAEASAAGWCGSWGIATWDARPVARVIGESAVDLTPGTILLRSGLSVADPLLTSNEQLCRVLGVLPHRRWGMSPFGGGTSERAWHTTSLQAFLTPGQHSSNLQAAFRVAYELPLVTRVAVGTSSPAHLRELVTATELAVSDTAISRYRELISKNHR
jgi:pyridoxine 4-dehydrogenase